MNGVDVKRLILVIVLIISLFVLQNSFFQTAKAEETQNYEPQIIDVLMKVGTHPLEYVGLKHPQTIIFQVELEAEDVEIVDVTETIQE